MKKIAFVLVAVLLIGCCAISGCNDGKFDMHLSISYVNSLSENYQKVLFEYPLGKDSIDIILYDEKGKEQVRTFELSNVEGVSDGVLKWADDGNVENAGVILKQCTYRDENGVSKQIPYDKEIGYKLDGYGTYSISFAVLANEDIGFNQSIRTVKLNITFLSTSVGGEQS